MVGIGLDDVDKLKVEFSSVVFIFARCYRYWEIDQRLRAVKVLYCLKDRVLINVKTICERQTFLPNI